MVLAVGVRPLEMRTTAAEIDSTGTVRARQIGLSAVMITSGKSNREREPDHRARSTAMIIIDERAVAYALCGHAERDLFLL